MRSKSRLITASVARLSPIKERVWIDGQEGDTQVFGLPTLDDAIIFWDARAVIGGSTYYYYAADAQKNRYKELLGLTCMAIVEFMVSDVAGSKQRLVFQMNEEVFKTFVRAVRRADEQLASLIYCQREG